MSIQTGWRKLAEPTYATSRFGRTVEFPAGTAIRSLVGSVVGSEVFSDAIRVVTPDGTPFECEKTAVYRATTDDVVQVEVPALWWVTASALRFQEEGDEAKWAQVREFMENTPQSMPADPIGPVPGSGLARAAAQRRRS